VWVRLVVVVVEEIGLAVVVVRVVVVRVEVEKVEVVVEVGG